MKVCKGSRRELGVWGLAARKNALVMPLRILNKFFNCSPTQLFDKCATGVHHISSSYWGHHMCYWGIIGLSYLSQIRVVGLSKLNFHKFKHNFKDS